VASRMLSKKLVKCLIFTISHAINVLLQQAPKLSNNNIINKKYKIITTEGRR